MQGSDLLSVEIAQQRGPLGLQFVLGAAVEQLRVQNQREEGAEDLTANGGVGGMEDQTRRERRFGDAEQRLDGEQVPISKHPFESAPLTAPVQAVAEQGIWNTVGDRGLSVPEIEDLYVAGDNPGFGCLWIGAGVPRRSARGPRP